MPSNVCFVDVVIVIVFLWVVAAFFHIKSLETARRILCGGESEYFELFFALYSLAIVFVRLGGWMTAWLAIVAGSVGWLVG